MPSKIDLRDNTKTVSTEALMTVYHPQDAENLDPKMVRDKVANSFWNLTGKDLSTFKTYSSKAAGFLCSFASLLSSPCPVFSTRFFMALFNFLLNLFNNDVPHLPRANSSCSSSPSGKNCLFLLR